MNDHTGGSMSHPFKLNLIYIQSQTLNLNSIILFLNDHEIWIRRLTILL